MHGNLVKLFNPNLSRYFYSVKKYLLIAQTEMHPGNQNMRKNIHDTRTFSY